MTSKVSASVTSARPRLSITLVDAVVDRELISPHIDASVLSPSVSTLHVSPVASVSSVIPATEIAYISMTFTADIDISGLFRYCIDSVSMVDGRSISITKAPSEMFAVLDGVAYTFGKISTDSVSALDFAVITLVILRSFADSQGIDDSTTITFTKSAYNSLTASDSTNKSIELGKADIASVLELLVKTAEKYQADDLTIIDASYVWSSKNFSDISSISDSIAKDGVGLAVDYLTPYDILSFSISKSIDDGFAMNDSAEAIDGLLFSFSIGIQNVVFLSDADQKNFEKTKSDSLSTSDSGLLMMQDYIDLTYFSEDYVGTSYIF